MTYASALKEGVGGACIATSAQSRQVGLAADLSYPREKPVVIDDFLMLEAAGKEVIFRYARLPC